MPIGLSVGFQDPSITNNFLMQAAATQVGRYTVQQDFDPEIEDILRKETVLWRLITQKKPANAPIVKKLSKQNRPTVGFVDKNNLTAVFSNPSQLPSLSLADPGQEVKALGGSIEFQHFGRSMADQQNRPYGDEVAEETNDLLINCARFLEMSLFTGNATSSQLQFNGIDQQTLAEHIFSIDTATATPAKVVDKLNEICVRASTDRNRMRRITHIICTGAGNLLIRDEVGQNLLYHNLQEVVAGINVPGIVTANGIIPIITTPYLNDLKGATTGTDDQRKDTCRFYLIDIDCLEWRGVYPFGGQKTFEPQIFDISNTINGLPLVEKRMVLMYGTLYAKNGGEGIYRLDVKVPANTVWNIGTELLK